MPILQDLWAVTLALHPEGVPFLDLKAGPGTHCAGHGRAWNTFWKGTKHLTLESMRQGPRRSFLIASGLRGSECDAKMTPQRTSFWRLLGYRVLCQNRVPASTRALFCFQEGPGLYTVWNCFFGYSSRAFFWTFLG